MGEAKRRKQLGLMPSVHPFEARLNEDGQVTLLRFTAPEEWREKTRRALQQHLDRQNWPRRYRREYIMAGLPPRLLRTAADVEAIEVPGDRRLLGELLLNYDPKKKSGSLATVLRSSLHYLPILEKVDAPAPERQECSNWAHVKEEYSFDGQCWQSFPESNNPFEGLRNLMQHPVTELQGELVARYQTLHRPGEPVQFDPEPAPEHRQELRELLNEWFGGTPEEWAEHFHEAQQTPTALEPFTPLPTHIRGSVELRRPAPMPGVGNIPMSVVDDLDVFLPFEERTYSPDGGEQWLPYDVFDPAHDDDDPLEVAYTVEVWADGRMNLSHSELSGPQRNMLRAVLPEWTGAGQPDTWAERARVLMQEELPLVQDQELPVPQGLKMIVFEGLWWEPQENRALNIGLSALNFDGEHWRDLYDDELPLELQSFQAPNVE